MAKRLATLFRAARQEQFLDVISRAEAEARLRRHLDPRPSGVEMVPLGAARGRVLAEDLQAPVDAPGFDRASVDGFAVRAADTAGATPEAPVTLRLNAEILTPGVAARPGSHPRHRQRDRDRRDAAPRRRRRGDGRGHGSPCRSRRRPVRRDPSPRASRPVGRDRRLRHRARGDCAAAGAAADLARDCHAGGRRSGRSAGLAPPAGRHPLDRRRDRGPRHADPPRPGVRQQRRRARCRDRGAWRRAGAARHRARRRGGAGGGTRPRAGRVRPGAAVRRHVEGCGRSRASGGGAARRSRHHRPRRRAEAGQAALPGGHGRQAGRGAARLPDLGDVHLPHLRRPGDQPARRAGAPRGRGTCPRRCRCASRPNPAGPSM